MENSFEGYPPLAWSSDWPEFQNNPSQQEVTFFKPEIPLLPTEPEKPVYVPPPVPPPSDDVSALLIKVIGEMTVQHHEDRKKLDALKKELEKVNEAMSFLVGAKRKKLQHSKNYREKKRRTIPDIFLKKQ